jgi:hypothetical protein
VFDVDPGTGSGATTTLTVTYYHSLVVTTTTSAAPAPGTNPNGYTQFDEVVLSRTRSDGPVANVAEFPVPALALGAGLLMGAGAFYMGQRDRTGAPAVVT